MEVVKKFFVNFGGKKITIEIIYLRTSMNSYSVYETQIKMGSEILLYTGEIGGPRSYEVQMQSVRNIFSCIKKMKKFAKETDNKLPEPRTTIDGFSIWQQLLQLHREIDMEYIFDLIGYSARVVVSSDSVEVVYHRTRKEWVEEMIRQGVAVVVWQPTLREAEKFIRENWLSLAKQAIELEEKEKVEGRKYFKNPFIPEEENQFSDELEEIIIEDEEN